MFAYVVRRILLMIPTTLGVALLVFLMYQAAPGDPATVMIGFGGMTEMEGDTDFEARIEGFKRDYGLDRSMPVQFLNYIGPFNLGRDGHGWFSSPFTERRTEEVELEDGTTAVEGSPLEITARPDTDPAVAEAAAAEVARLMDDSAGQAEWDAARNALAAADDVALPPLLSGLYSLRLALDTRGEAVERLSGALAQVTGHAPDAPAERVARDGQTALIRHWFGWYYTHGGYRVPNTGEDPWGGLLVGDLGKEMQRKTPVLEELVERLKFTVPMSLASMFLIYLIAIPLGIYAVRRQGTLDDGLVSLIVFFLFSIPSFWAGLMLQFGFGADGLEWLPVIGLKGVDYNELGGFGKVWDILKHCILPLATLTYGGFAFLSRQMRAGMLENIRQDYIRTARAKGLSETVVVYKHALRNSVIPIITLAASVLPIMIGGSIVVEAVFDLPGMGMYAFEGLQRRDFYVVMAVAVFVGIMTQIGILLSDIAYSMVDPRIRYD